MATISRKPSPADEKAKNVQSSQYEQAIAGWLADRSASRQSSFFAGLAMLFGATLFFAVGSSPIILMVARFFQGASSGIVFTVGLALLVDTVGRNEIGAWIGFALSGMSVGIMVGPFLGGIIYANAGYYAVFAVILGVIAFDFILRLFMIEKKAAARWTEGSSSTDGTKYGTFSDDANGSNPPISGDDHEPPQSDLVASNGRTNDENLPNPWIHDAEPASTSHTKRPSMAKHLVEWLMERFPTTYVLLSSPRLLAAMYGGFVHISLVSSFESILPLFVQRTFRWDSSGTGAIFLAISIPSLASSLVGALSDRFGTRKVVLGGFAVSTIALALLSLVTHNSVGQIVFLCALLALIGLGTTMMLSPLAADMVVVVDQMGNDNKDLFGATGAYAQAYGLFDTALACGTIFGPAFAGFLYERAGWKIAVWALAVFCASGSVPIVSLYSEAAHGPRFWVTFLTLITAILPPCSNVFLCRIDLLHRLKKK
ncbi:hypothetical protein MMC12_008131 [Toensbergia leucococca]|nr:hypothetical protein [Toensbergia leucococca]